MNPQVPNAPGWWWFACTSPEADSPGTPLAVLMRRTDAGYLFGHQDGWLVDLQTHGIRWLGPVAPPGSPAAGDLEELEQVRAEIARLQKERVHPYAVHVISEHAAALSEENKRLREALAQAEIGLAWDVQP